VNVAIPEELVSATTPRNFIPSYFSTVKPKNLSATVAFNASESQHANILYHGA
jgi:hypothetical protein